MTEIEKREAVLVELATARAALEEAETLPAVASLIDRAEILRVVARRAKLSLDAQNDWAEYKLDAERKAGQMLESMELHKGGRPTENRSADHTGNTPQPVSSPPRLADLGIRKDQSAAWKRIAALPDNEYEAFKTDARAKGKEITEAGALRIAKHQQREKVKHEKAAEFAATVPQRPQVTLASWEEWLPAQPICDLLVTDPPYSTDVEDIGEFANAWLPTALDKVKPSGRAYVCIGAYPAELQAYLDVSPPDHLVLANVLVWTYRNTLGPSPSHDYKLNWQAILYYRGVESPPLNSPEMVEQFSVQDINAPDGRQGDRWHAWQKPDLLAERFIRHSTRPDELVLDPFAGTGTFLLAAAKLGRRAFGCDINAENIAIAEERGCRRA